ncbi:nitrate- and nitrite sensing domain-containing protein [Micromonospora sp. SH-82]|uniref:sensor histidine kinase n=1 Tax=Micromonospora sp. SH-82 TaxID=3132938 RepID=UPI003EC0CA37
MRYRSTNLRTKVIALLLSLVALWSFAAWVTLRDGVTLLGIRAMDTEVAAPSEVLVPALQDERRLSVAYLAAPNESRREALQDGRRTVDELAADFRRTATGWTARLAGTDQTRQRIDAAVAELDALPGVRRSVDERAADRSGVQDAYTRAVGSHFLIYDVIGGIGDRVLEADTRHLIEIYRVRELVAQQDTLLAGVFAAGRVTPAEHSRFGDLVAAQRFLADRTLDQMRADDRSLFQTLLTSTDLSRLGELQDRITAGDRDVARPVVAAQDWEPAADRALSGLQESVLDGGDKIVDRAIPAAVMVVVRLILAAGLGLIAVIASIVISVTTTRALMTELQRLRDTAHKLADERLPAVVQRLGRGEKVDVATEAPPLDVGDDEIGQVGQAFNRVQETAIRTAVEQAELRRAVRDVFLSLARRTQGLVHRQVTLLDTMERQEESPEKLEDLFRVDHLATRMRRNAENLIVLSGAAPGRAWRRNVPMLDVARAATQEVEDYPRVQVLPLGSVGLAGRAVSDVIHLLAELVENALTFSPPHTQVEVRGQLVANGFAIEIEDRGLGMSEEEYAAANEQIATPRDFTLSNANQLGLFVVSQLAARHGLGVRLKNSPYGGTTAVVLIPMDLVTGADGFRREPASTKAPAPNAGGLPDRARTRAGEPGGSVALAQRGPVPSRGPAPSADPTPSAGPSPSAGPVPSAGPAPTSDVLATQELPTITPAGPARPTDTPSPAQRPPATAPETPPTPTTPRVAEDGAPLQATPPKRPAATPPDGGQTPAGLPVRVRQSSIAPQLRDSPTVDDDADDDAPVTSPDRVRRTMSSYQRGTLRGRADAERLQDTEGDDRPDPEDPPARGTDR